MSIHFEPVQWIVRGYEDGCSFELRSPYRLVGNVFVVGDVATMFATHGELPREDREAIRAGLLERGAVDLLVIRKRRRVWYDLESGKIVAWVRRALPERAG